MTEQISNISLPSAAHVFASSDARTVPVYLVRNVGEVTSIADLSTAQQAWVLANGFKAKPCQTVNVSALDGSMAAVLFGIGDGDTGQPCGGGEWLLGDLPRRLPPANYRIENAQGSGAAEAAALSWGLGSYRFRRYRTECANDQEPPRLVIPENINAEAIRTTTEAVWLGRDMINTPANDLGPADIEAWARALAERGGANVEVIAGDDLLKQNFPMIHAVGRASNRLPRLIDIRWGREDAPKITLVGKGICFDTGGLDLKPPAGMLLMKKDMGGAAATLALASMIMGLGVDVRLRVLIAAAENSVSSNAFRPGDVLVSRAGHTVEIGNTDAEGRLLLADALALADEEKPQLLASFATLTGAARVALGPDLPAMFSTSDEAAQAVVDSGLQCADPVWRMPFWAGYDKSLSSTIADMNNISDGPFGGAITAALFIKRFVKKTNSYMHFDLYGWRTAQRPMGPKGGEPHVARAMLAYIQALAQA